MSLTTCSCKHTNYVECPFTEGLTKGVEQNKDQVRRISQPCDGLIDIKGVLHVTVNQPWGVNKRHQAEPLLL